MALVCFKGHLKLVTKICWEEIVKKKTELILTWIVWILADEDMFALPGDDDDDDDDNDIFTRPSGLFTSRSNNLFAASDEVIWCTSCGWYRSN